MNEKVIKIIVFFILCSSCATSKTRKDELYKNSESQSIAEDPSIFDKPMYHSEPNNYHVPSPKLRHEQEASNHLWSGYGEDEYVHDSLSTELILGVIDSHGTDIQACYQKISPNLELPRKTDTILVQMTILGSGQTRDVLLLNSSTETWLNPPLEKCLSSKILNWRFQKSQSEQIVIQQQFLLSP
ncbi:MAG: AgmX/PglI C-terminal domain-containing protein [Oligoflexales bacterium]